MTKADVLLTAAAVQGPWPTSYQGFVRDLFEVDFPLQVYRATDRLREHANSAQIWQLAKLRRTLSGLLFDSDGPMYLDERGADWPEEWDLAVLAIPSNFSPKVQADVASRLPNS